ncbi:MAG TPA: hypothetical protein VF580_12765 [Thermoanaerobaculia bacterium]
MFDGNIPVAIEAISGRDLVAEFESWARKEARHREVQEALPGQRVYAHLDRVGCDDRTNW